MVWVGSQQRREGYSAAVLQGSATTTTGSRVGDQRAAPDRNSCNRTYSTSHQAQGATSAPGTQSGIQDSAVGPAVVMFPPPLLPASVVLPASSGATSAVVVLVVVVVVVLVV